LLRGFEVSPLLQVVGGNGAEQTVLTPEWIRGSTATLLGNTNLWRSGAPVQEQLFNASSCLHYSPCNLVQQGELLHGFGRTRDFSSLEVAVPILILRDDSHQHRKGSNWDLIFLINRGEVLWFINVL